MIRVLAFLLALAPSLAWGQSSSPGTQVTTSPIATTPTVHGQGFLSVSTSVLINTMTVTDGALPTNFTFLEVIVEGASDVAFCGYRVTCTCPTTTGIAASSGEVIKASGGADDFNLTKDGPLGVAAATPSAISCGSASIVNFKW